RATREPGRGGHAERRGPVRRPNPGGRMSIVKHKYALLARRELWEHKALWLAPAIVAAVMVVLPLLGARNVGYGPFGQNIDASTPDGQAVRDVIPGLFGQMTMLGV